MLPTVRAQVSFLGQLAMLGFVPGLRQFWPNALKMLWVVEHVYRRIGFAENHLRRVASQGSGASVHGGRRGTAKERTVATGHSTL